MGAGARGGERGFTLIEAMVALVVFMVGILSVLQMTYVYIQANTQNQQASEAAIFASDKMEQLRSYASSDRVDKYSVFDFDYIVSNTNDFTTVFNPATNSAINVDGLLSGNNSGTPTTTPWGVTYEILYDNGTHGDVAANDGVYTNTDDRAITTQAMAAIANGAAYSTLNEQQKVHRLWTVAPYVPAGSPAGTLPDYANLYVKVWWFDKWNKQHNIELYSAIHRRQ